MRPALPGLRLLLLGLASSSPDRRPLCKELELKCQCLGLVQRNGGERMARLGRAGHMIPLPLRLM